MTANRTTPAHLLFDFGEVISTAQPGAEVAALAALADLPGPEFSRRYWALRPGYDAGGPALAYWSGVLGAAPGRTELRRLVELDVASWLHLNPDTLRLLDDLHAAGTAVSLLSNAPHELARELDGLAELKPFRRRLFSADLELTKPDPRCFQAALAALGAEPGELFFVDDRPANVEAAVALGMNGLVFRGTPACRATVTGAVIASGTRTGRAHPC